MALGGELLLDRLVTSIDVIDAQNFGFAHCRHGCNHQPGAGAHKIDEHGIRQTDPRPPTAADGEADPRMIGQETVRASMTAASRFLSEDSVWLSTTTPLWLRPASAGAPAITLRRSIVAGDSMCIYMDDPSFAGTLSLQDVTLARTSGVEHGPLGPEKSPRSPPP